MRRLALVAALAAAGVRNARRDDAARRRGGRARQLPRQPRPRRRPGRSVAEGRAGRLQLAPQDRPGVARRPGSRDTFRDRGSRELPGRDSPGRQVPRRSRDDVGRRRVHVPALPRSQLRLRPEGRLSGAEIRGRDRSLQRDVPPAAAVGVIPDQPGAWASSRPAPARKPDGGRLAAARIASSSSCPTTTSRCRRSTSTTAARRRIAA